MKRSSKNGLNNPTTCCLKGDHMRMSFIVNGEAVAQGRPRITTVNGYARAYDPAKSSEYKHLVAFYAQQEMKGKPLMEGPLCMEVLVNRCIPASWSKKKHTSALQNKLWPTSRPDIDNYVKCVLDALQQVVWLDDRQVVNIYASKRYSVQPSLMVTVRTIDEY